MGDQNNKTFHNSVRTRQSQKTIREIRRPDGSVAVSHSKIKNKAERFFSESLNRMPASFKGTSEEKLQDLLDFRCTTKYCRALEAEVTAEEIMKVLFSMPSNKSPGPDGYPCEFFKQSSS